MTGEEAADAEEVDGLPRVTGNIGPIPKVAGNGVGFGVALVVSVPSVWIGNQAIWGLAIPGQIDLVAVRQRGEHLHHPRVGPFSVRHDEESDGDGRPFDLQILELAGHRPLHSLPRTVGSLHRESDDDIVPGLDTGHEGPNEGVSTEEALVGPRFHREFPIHFEELDPFRKWSSCFWVFLNRG
jgi:hypothetical protein